MLRVAVMLLAASGLILAQEQPAPEQGEKRIKYRVKEVGSWSLQYNDETKQLTLTWKGTILDKFTGEQKTCDECVIEFLNRTMTKDGKHRLFSREEATEMGGGLFDLIANYGAMSLAWWEEGYGTPLEPDDPEQPSEQQKPLPDKERKTEPKPSPTNLQRVAQR